MKDQRENKDKVKPLPSAEELHRVLAYDPLTGILTWKERPRADFKTDRSHKVWNTRYAGTPALNGIGKKGYRIGHLFGTLVKASRVIWKMVEGVEPETVDHADHVKSNNALANLRNVTDQVNAKNRKLYSTNLSGISGVYWNKGMRKWHAQIKFEGKLVHLGVFDELEDARAARLEAQTKYGYHDNHGRAASQP